MAFDDMIQKEKHEVHLGRNIQRIREMVGIKQSALADNAGMSQQNVSKLESSPIIADETLEKLATGLGVTSDFVKNFNEEKAVYNIQTNITVNENGSNNQHYQPTFNNDIDKLVDMFERLLKSEKEKAELLAKANEALKELVKEARGKK